jgi:hypothetical protein
LEASDIYATTSSGAVSGTYEVGGLVGLAYDDATIGYSKASGNVSGDTFVGGLVGGLAIAQIFDSYATGGVSATSDRAGGVVGYIDSTGGTPSALVRSYATGAVTAGSAAGGLVGYLDLYGSIVDSYWSSDANSDGIGLNESEVTTTDPPGSTLLQLQDIATFAPEWKIVNGWAAFVVPSAVWGICDGDDTPYLLWEETESPCGGGEWNVSGFFQPVDMDGVFNVAQAGRTVPLKWRIVDSDGVPVSDSQSFVKIQSTMLGCASASLTVEDGVENYVANSGLRHLGDGYWQFNWATSKSFAGQCRTVTLTLSDGSTISANFRFRR